MCITFFNENMKSNLRLKSIKAGSITFLFNNANFFYSFFYNWAVYKLIINIHKNSYK